MTRRAPLRLAITPERPLDAEERSGLAALLVRTRLPLEILPVGKAHHFLHLRGGGAAPVDTPEALLDSLLSSLRRVESHEENSLSISVLRVVSRILSGGLEATAPLDHHGRPSAAGCPQVAQRLLRAPLIDQLGIALRTMLLRLCQAPELSLPSVTAVLSFDVDSSGWFEQRNVLGTLRRHARQPLQLLGARLQRRDPAIDLPGVLAPLREAGLPATVLLQTHRWHRLDSYSLRDGMGLVVALREALLENPKLAVGLHSSYCSRERPATLYRKQWRRLESLFGAACEPSHRAHYLRAPDCIADIKGPRGQLLAESSLGFGEANGFRRLTSLAFPIGDHALELPFCWMDSTALFFEKETAEASVRRMLEDFETVRAVGGCFVCVMHPHLMNRWFFGRRESLLAELIAGLQGGGARFQSLAHAAAEQHATIHAIESALEVVLR